MKTASKGLLTNGIKSQEQAGPQAKTMPVQAVLKTKGKSAPKSAIKAKQKAMPATGKKLGNHYP